MSKLNRRKANLRKAKRENIMRKIPLPTRIYIVPESRFAGEVEIPPEEQRTETFNYATALDGIVLRSDQNAALSLKDLRHCNAINDALEAALDSANGDGPVMLLEEADYDYLIGKVKSFPWRRWSRFTTQFIEDLEGAEKFKPEDKKSEEA